jgi:hypothetical protein
VKINSLRKFLFLSIVLGYMESASAQFSSLQTNLVGWGSTNMNLEYSMKLRHRWTAHFPVQYNPFSLGNARLRNLTTMPGVRYWMRETYAQSFFIGGYGIATVYNVGGLLGGKYRYEGSGIGAGLSFGYSKPLSTHWNLEFEAGAGFLWTSYDTYVCGTCGKKKSTDKGVRYIPSKLALNIVYLF